MIAITNLDPHDIQIPFEGTTYVFPEKKTVTIEDELLSSFLKENFPKTFAINTEKLPEDLPVAESFKTKSFLRQESEQTKQDMIVSPINQKATFGNPDSLPNSGTTDGDGVSWYGEGVEQDNG